MENFTNLWSYQNEQIIKFQGSIISLSNFSAIRPIIIKNMGYEVPAIKFFGKKGIESQVFSYVDFPDFTGYSKEALDKSVEKLISEANTQCDSDIEWLWDNCFKGAK